MWHDEDQEEVADVVRGSEYPVVDLQDVMIDPTNPELLLPTASTRASKNSGR